MISGHSGSVEHINGAAEPSSRLLLVTTLLGLALVFKVLYLCSYATTSPYYDLARLDSGVYVEWAKSINREGWLGHEVFYQAPLYPYFLSIIFKLFGESFLSVYVIQLLMGVCIVALIYLVGRRVYGERSALISALLCLTYAPFTSFETKVLTTITEMFLGLLSMYFLTKAEQEGRGFLWVAGATCLGLAIICRPNYALVVPFMALFLAMRHRRRIREAIPPLVSVVLIPCFIVGAVTMRNYIVSKDIVLISSSGGVTFAQGNNPTARGAMVVLPGFSGSPIDQRTEEGELAERETGRALKPSEVSSFWFRWALGFIKEHPLRYLKLCLDKVLLITNNRELGNNYLMSIDMALTPILKLAFLPFGFIMAWAAIGLLVMIRRGSSGSILIATFFGTFLMLILFYVSTRFRMTLAPAAVIMAGGGIDWLLGNLRNMRRVALVLCAVTAVLVISLPSFLPLSSTQLLSRDAKYWANLGVAFEMKGRLEQALWAHEQAIALNPGTYDSYRNKAKLLETLHADKRDLLPWRLYVAGRFPREYSAHVMLADTYAALGRNAEAVQSYRKAIAVRVDESEAYLRLGELLGRIGDHHEARAVLARGLKTTPENIRLQYSYALACITSGERKEAARRLKEVLSRDPDHSQSQRLLRELETKKPE